MGNENWLLLTDYSSKYRISVSTLRRRIKADQIPFRFENGKYFLLDRAPDLNVDVNPKTGLGPIQLGFGQKPPEAMATAVSRGAIEAVPLKKSVTQPLMMERDPVAEMEAAQAAAGKEAPLISTATKLLNELKRAYMSILQEKEEQLIQLKEEVSDLKTLVRVLEDDNERMRTVLGLQSHK